MVVPFTAELARVAIDAPLAVTSKVAESRSFLVYVNAIIVPFRSAFLPIPDEYDLFPGPL